MSVAMLARKRETAPAPRSKAPSKAASTGLRVSEPNDAFEREADRVADQVMAGSKTKPEWSLSKITIGNPVQRKCDCGGSSGSEGECEECKKKTMQHKAAGDVGTGYAPLIVQDVLNSPGQPLDAATRAFMEPRFGRDFNNVRVHTDARAAASARAVSAMAYSVGRDIVFGTGQYAPGTRRGLELLGHELTHCVQQGAVMSSSSDRLKISDSGDAAESEARVASSIVLRSSSPRPTRRTRRQLARQTSPARQDQPQAAASCGPDVTDWFVNVMNDARKNPAALAIQKDLTNAAAGGARYGYSASDVLEGGVARTVLAAEKAAGNPTRTEAAKSQLAAADPQNQFGRATLIGTLPIVGAPEQMMFALIKRAGERWKSMVQTGAVWDFKNNVLSASNLAQGGCPAACPDPPTLTMCGKCYENNLPGDLLYASVGRFCGFSLNALQLGSQFAELQPNSTRNWDPPGDTADINLGFSLPADLTRGNLCSTLAGGGGGITVRPCAPCSVSFPSGGAGPSQQVPSPSPPGSGILQRKPISDNAASSEGECEECNKKGILQQQASDSSGPSEAPPIVHEVLRSPGEPLPEATRSLFESRFRHDFSKVRVHSDSKAAESADAVHALAYTVGNDVVFGDGSYKPASMSGQRLVAHELAHVVQQPSAPMLQRQPKDQAAGGGAVGPLVQKFVHGEATPEDKATLKKQLLAGQLTPAEVEALQSHLEEGFRAALTKAIAPLGGQPGQINATIGGPVGDVHTFFKAKLRLRLTGAAKVVASGLEGTVETTIEVNADKNKKTVTVVITPPAGDTSLAALIRAKVFPNGPLSLQLGEIFLKAINMISLQGDLTVFLTGNKGAGSGGLVISSPDIPEDVELEVTLSQSATKPQVAPATGSPALPSPRAFLTGGAVAGPKQTGAATTAGFDLPLFTDTKNPLMYGGVGLRAGADTRGDLTGGGSIFTGIHLSPVTLQVALEAGVARSPGTQTSAGTGARTSAYFGAEATVGVQVLKHVEVIALASVLGGGDLPAGESLQAGAACKF